MSYAADIILCFHSSNMDVHRQVADLFDDQEAHRFIGSYLPHTPAVSMRYWS